MITQENALTLEKLAKGAAAARQKLIIAEACSHTAIRQLEREMNDGETIELPADMSGKAIDEDRCHSGYRFTKVNGFLKVELNKNGVWIEVRKDY